MISTLSKDEIRFVLANKRYSMGKPILSDTEYDALRSTLKELRSPVVLHGALRLVSSGQQRAHN